MLTARRQSAATIAELVAVAAATAVVVALAYSAYRTYQVRLEVNEGILVASEHIANVTELFHRYGEVLAALDPASEKDTSSASPFVASVAVIDGRIDIVYGNRADPSIAGRRVSLTPYETADRQVMWICGNRTPGPGLEPLGFASGGRQAAHAPATVEARFLSPHCR